ncbi:alpha-hydroxyketone-type quorum-sensing autoinducer synthase [Ramlibacter sp. MAHUQ-53]|uniref:alpha-hydroxyketone-type quorum-sensing autoinducer synthase n=1 Tax=unclassified Ramlibacter TaxID=2617605 RepID=UPI003630CFB9
MDCVIDPAAGVAAPVSPSHPAAGSRPASTGAPLSAALRERLARDFHDRFHREWGGRFFTHGRVPGPDAIRLDGNDYLSVVDHPEIVQAQLQALAHARSAVVQSSIFQFGDTPAGRFERDMADWLGAEDSFLCQSGYAANLGLLQILADPGSPVYLDMMAHMSLWEGVRASGAVAHGFRHNDPAHLRKLMAQHGPGVVVVDTVYSATGALCRLAEVVEAAEAGGSMVVADESHALGTHGPQGRGLCAHLGLTHRVHFITASLAKSFAGRAGIFTLPRELRDYLAVHSFPFIFSSSLLPHEVAGLHATLHVIRRSDAARAALTRHTARLRGTLAGLGYPIAQGSEQIIALEAGTEVATLALRDALEARGVFGAVFISPATSRNRALVRLTLNAGLTEAEVAQVEAVAAEIAPLVRPWDWAAARRQRVAA